MALKVLITGGLGFIGSTIAHKFSGAKITVYDACLEPYGWNYANIKGIGAEVVKGDIRDFELLKKHVKGKDIVIDCAAQVSHTISVKNPLLDVDINCTGALNVLEAVRLVNKNARVLYAGTRGQIGKMQYSPIDEKHPSNPVDFNGINKHAAEQYHMAYHRIYGIKTTSLRINNAYGPRSQMKHGDYGIVNWFLRLAMEDKQIIINGKGLQTRDYSFVEDIADAFVLAAKTPKTIGKFYMLGSGKEVKFIDMCNLILKTTNSKMKIKHRLWPEERKAIEIGNFCISYKKFCKDTGWKPKTSFTDGLKKTYFFYKQRKEEYF